mgnify:CR=1 FL=1
MVRRPHLTFEKPSGNTSSRCCPFSVLYSIPNIDIVEIDFQQKYGVTETLFHSYLADILRIKKLEEHGGVWFDTDILFLNGIGDNLLKFPQNKSVKTMVFFWQAQTNTVKTMVFFA